LNGRIKTLNEVCQKLDKLYGKIKEANGSQHRIALQLRDVLLLAEDMIREAMTKAEAETRTLDLERRLDDDTSDSPKPLVTSNDLPESAKEEYIKQKRDSYRAVKSTDQQRRPRDLVAETIAKRVAEAARKLAAIPEAGVKDDSEHDSGDEDRNENKNEDGSGKEDEGGKAKLKIRDKSKSYTDNLRALSKDPSTLDQVYALSEAKLRAPNFLGRTASLTSGTRFKQSNKSNGSTTQDILMPAADTDKEYDQHTALIDLSQGEIIYMTGHHLAWADLHGDEFLSYSNNILFLLAHALGRANRGEGGVTIQFLDCRKARTTDGVRTGFYHALDLYTIFGVPKWPGWRGQHITKLHPRKFTHEFLSHGTVCSHDPTLKQARLEDLIRDGLYQIFPPFQTPEDHKEVGLYEIQVIYRQRGYQRRQERINEKNPPIYSYDDCPYMKAMDIEELQTVRKVNLNFRHLTTESESIEVEPHLHIFIKFLTLWKRQPADPVFTQWIKQRYTRTSHICPCIHT